MVDAPASKAGAARRGGSSPPSGTIGLPSEFGNISLMPCPALSGQFS
jgi:hypothetical protein